LRVSLVSLPVKGYTASTSGAEIRMNQLHAACHGRIKYKKECPLHGEVGGDQIVSGYEYAKGQYVVIDSGELDVLRTDGDRAIAVDAFVPFASLDPVYFTGKTYYLVPDGPVGQKPYALLRQLMREQQLCALAQVVFSGREQLVAVRPAGKLLAMEILHYEGKVKNPSCFAEEVTDPELSAEERRLAGTLVAALTKQECRLGDYRDGYTEKLTQLIEAKVEGKELVTPPPSEAPQVINLMEALRKSVANAQRNAIPVAKAAPKRKRAPSARKRRRAASAAKTG
jgi:DNA end-binding protein Ku